MKILFLFFLLFFNVNAFSETFLSIKDSSFAPYLKTRVLNWSHDITCRQDYTVEPVSVSIQEQKNVRIHFRPHEDFKYQFLSIVENYLGSKVEVIYVDDSGKSQSIEGTFALMHVSVEERIKANEKVIDYYLKAKNNGHILSLSVNRQEVRIALKDLREIHLLDRREVKLPSLPLVVDRTLITSYQVFNNQVTREFLAKNFNTAELSFAEISGILDYSENIGRQVMVFVNPWGNDKFPKIISGQILGLGITTSQKRGNMFDMYTSGYEVSKAKILAKQNYLLLKVKDKEVRIPIQTISSLYEFDNGDCAEKIIYQHTP